MAQPRTNRSTRPLSEAARHVVIPDGILTTGWPAVEKRCAEFGDKFDEWQRGAGRVMLGKREGGEYAATVGGITLSIPRQVAKTFLVSRIIFALCTLFPGLTVLWSAHRTRTASKTFAGLRSYAAKKSVAPYVSAIRSVNGEQEIHFHNGSVIMFGAREQGFGRGFDEVDIEVFDEAQILTEKALEDMVAATNQSRFPAGALLFFMGTPPRPNDPSEAFKLRRREALEVKASRGRGVRVDFDGVYIECSADPDADPDDRTQWAKANPSFPHRTPLRSMLRLRKNLPAVASWLREALGIWDSDQVGSRFIPASLWAKRGIAAAPDGIRSYGVAFSRDGSRASLAGAVKHEGGIHVELIDGAHGPIEATISALADWLAGCWRDTAQITISGGAGDGVLFQALRERGVPESVITKATLAVYTTSCAMLWDGLNDGTATHLEHEGQQVLDDSVAVCDQKQRGSAWGWEATTPDGDETPLEAISLALYGAKTSKRRPGRVAKVTF